MFAKKKKKFQVSKARSGEILRLLQNIAGVYNITRLFVLCFPGDWPENTTQPEIAIVTAPHHVTVEKKSPLLLNCSVVTTKTFGALEFTWLKDGVPIAPQVQDRRIQIFQNGSLYFRRIVHRKRRENRLSDEGLYECVAGNDNGRVVARRVQVEIAGMSCGFASCVVSCFVFVEFWLSAPCVKRSSSAGFPIVKSRTFEMAKFSNLQCLLHLF